jgi:hypothetical protein
LSRCGGVDPIGIIRCVTLQAGGDDIQDAVVVFRRCSNFSPNFLIFRQIL